MSNRGQSLFELIAAVAVIAIVLVALIGLATQSVSDSVSARNRTQASRRTQEVVEWMRNERDTNWLAFVGKATGAGQIYCLVELDYNITVLCDPTTPAHILLNSAGEITPFVRNLRLTVISDSEIEVDVWTVWEDGSGSHNSRATTVLTDFRSF